MFSITRRAAEQVLKSQQEEMSGLSLRIAAKTNPDGSIDYGIGFDEPGAEDIKIVSHGVNLVIASDMKELLANASMDYVELEPGKFHFIFLNPNDPDYVPPKESEADA